ncbi:Brp/Blh family beta-carotene 15,15'-dioxygenase [Haloferax sp. DFSO60]|uniref:Brp/Blh family beta-carotene 15,15'-dioxygenase n=1 Tax=Haloferax sp. DFSO60 TaxID=3388652 RepID=UPI00397B41BF
MAVTAQPETQPPGETRRVARLIFEYTWLVVAVATLLWSVGGTLPSEYRYVPLLLSMVIFGLPHGALDHVTLPRERGTNLSVRSLAVVGLLYALFATAYAAVWFTAPTLAFVTFLLLTWFHWGTGDLFPLVLLVERTHLDTRLQRVFVATARGAIPLLVPIIAHPVTYREAATAVVQLFDPTLSLTWLTAPTFRTALGIGFTALTLTALFAGRLGVVDAETRRSWYYDLTETALLILLFVVLPPIVALGVYFPLWHSTRHLARIALLDDRTAGPLRDGRIGTAALKLGIDAIPMTVGALVIFALLAVAVPTQLGSMQDLADAYLVLLAVFTLPHTIIVTWLDKIQHIW